MWRFTMATLTILLCVWHTPALPAADKVRSIAATEPSTVTIEQTSLKIDDDLLELHCRIQNDSPEDIWIFVMIAFVIF